MMSDASSRCMHGARMRPAAVARLRFQDGPMLLERHSSPATRYWRDWTSAGWNGSSCLVGESAAAASAALRIAAVSELSCCFTTLSLVPDARLSVLWKSEETSLDGVSARSLTVLK